MSKKQINWIGTFDSIENENDLKLKPGININPPPEDGKCDCCGKPISELKPFGGPGDPLVGDFTGKLLVKGYRSICSIEEENKKDENDKIEAEKIFDEAQRCYEASGFDNPLDWLVEKYGKVEAKMIEFDIACLSSGDVTDSWECRDCIVLNDDEYWDKINNRTKSG